MDLIALQYVLLTIPSGITAAPSFWICRSVAVIGVFELQLLMSTTPSFELVGAMLGEFGSLLGHLEALGEHFEALGAHLESLVWPN